MGNKDIYLKLLLYASYALMVIGGVRILLFILNRIMSGITVSLLIFVIGAVAFVSYKNLSH